MRAIILLARAPSAPGKTRLTSTLAPEAAIALRRALFLDTYEVVCTVGEPVIVAFTPTAARTEIESLIAESAIKGTLPFSAVSAMPQRENCDLGDRMYAALVEAQRIGASHMVLVGSDMPTVPVAYLQDAFARLDAGADVVIGPSEDGGYYLIGMKTPDQRIFANIPWGTPRVLAATLEAATRLNLSAAQIRPWFDVDTRDDLARIRADSRSDAARHTRDWLTR